MLTARSGPAVGLTVQAALLAALWATVGLHAPGWVVGIASGVVINAAVAAALVRGAADHLGPADLVTLGRAMLACGAAALTADAFVGRPAVGALVALATVGLVLDAVDGWVARRTRSVSSFGARFDGEIDAFLMLVLSVYVARTMGGWVLVIGAARYVFAAAGVLWPWLRRRLPFRYWRKVVTATAGIVLTVAAADVLARPWTFAALVLALALVAESFGRDVRWLWRRREEDRRGAHTLAAALGHALAFAAVWFALLAPNQTGDLRPGAFLRIPVEALVLAALAVVLPAAGRRVLVVAAGGALGLLAVMKLVDIGFFTALDRPFSPVTDRAYLAPALDFVSTSFGAFAAALAVIAAALLLLGLLVGIPLALGRLAGVVARHRRGSGRAILVLGAVWVVSAGGGLQVTGDQPFASSAASRLAVEKVRAAVHDTGDLQRFEAAAASDDYRGTADLLSGLRGKDVLLVFVESYGRAALEDLASSPQVRAVLDDGTLRLGAAGYSMRSAFLTSPTAGGLSWLAHSTLQSGLWVDNEPRYQRLLEGNRLTLSRVFGREGWRTVAVKPTNTEPWPEGRAFYRLDRVYDRHDLGYQGPRFGFSAMPDQFALAAFHARELAGHTGAPVMAEVDLASSHSPWAPVPRMVPWAALGDGSLFEDMEHGTGSADDLWARPARLRSAYTDSIAYTLDVVVSFVETYGDDDLVLVVLGDHQPSPVVTGRAASRDVPVTLIARDRAVLERVAGWGWQDGLRPTPEAPVWAMDAFRDEFLAAFSGPPPSAAARVGFVLRP